MPVCFCKAFFSVLSVEGVEGAVAAVGGKELGGSGASSLSKGTLEGVLRSWERLGSDGVDVGSVVGGLRIAIMTEISSAESMNWQNSLSIGGVVSSIFMEVKGPDSICDRF